LGPSDVVEQSGHIALGNHPCMDCGRGAASGGYGGEATGS